MSHDHLNRRAIGRAWLAGALAIVLLATLTPQAGSSSLRQDFFAPLLPGSVAAGYDVLQNILLYMPFGLVLGLTGRSWGRTVLAAAVLSLATELSQFLVPGRDPVATDILVNTAGGSLGWIAARTPPGARARGCLLWVEHGLARALRPEQTAAAALSLAWAAVVSLVIVATCWLLSPAIPEPFYYLVTAPLIDAVPGPVRIGGDGSPDGAFSGLIDEVRIYAGARTAESIRADMGVAVAASRSDPDLVLAYGFDSDGQGFASDATGGDHDGVPRGAAWTPSGRFGGAAVFDGRTAEIMAPGFSGLDLQREMTVEAWVNPSGRQRGRAAVVAHVGDAYFLRASSRSGALAPSGGARFGENSREARLRGRIPANQWTHLATTYDGQAITLYVNGRQSVRLLHWSSHLPLEMSIDDLDLSAGFVPSPSRARSLLAGDFTLRLTLACGPLQREPAPVFAMVGVQSREVLTVDASGTELRVRSATWARRAGLAPVELRIPAALAECAPGTTRSLAVRGPLQNPTMEDGGGRQLAGVTPGVGSSWALFLDSRFIPAWLVAVLSAGYLALLTVPFGYWARLAPLTMVGALLLVGALSLVPEVWGTPRVGVLESAAAAAGALLGVLIRARVRPRV